MSDEINEKNSIHGRVVAKKCKCCDHHEIGVVKEDGEYVPLRHGMEIVGYLIPKKEA